MPDYSGWPAYGGGPEQIRYSSLTQINRSNVRQLQVAWTYDSAEAGGYRKFLDPDGYPAIAPPWAR